MAARVELARSRVMVEVETAEAVAVELAKAEAVEVAVAEVEVAEEVAEVEVAEVAASEVELAGVGEAEVEMAEVEMAEVRMVEVKMAEAAAVEGGLVGRRGELRGCWVFRRLVAADLCGGIGRRQAMEACGSPTASVGARVARIEPRGRTRRRLKVCSRVQMLKLAQITGGGVPGGVVGVSRGTRDGGRTSRVCGGDGGRISSN